MSRRPAEQGRKGGEKVALDIERTSVIEKAVSDIKAELRNKEIASAILQILSDNKTTVSEAISLLKLAETLITQSRLEIVRK